MYRPESPGLDPVYRPVSPYGREPVMVDRIGNIIQAMRNPKAVIRPVPFRPIYNWRDHVRILKANGQSYEHIEKQHLEWEQAHPPREPLPEKESINVPNDIEYVVVNLKVLKSGKVRVSASAPMDIIYHKYYVNCVKPPLEEFIVALKTFRYPNWVLENVIKSYENAPKLKAQMDKVMNQVFSKYSTKTPAKPKKQTLSKKMKIKK